MKKLILFPLLAVGLFACSSPCEKAYDAATECAEAAGGEVGDETAADACADDDGADDEMYECMADAYSAGDCSSDAGLLVAALGAMECAGGSLFDTSVSDSGN